MTGLNRSLLLGSLNARWNRGRDTARERAAGKNHEEGAKKAEKGEGDREVEMGVGREREKEGEMGVWFEAAVRSTDRRDCKAGSQERGWG